MFTVNRKRLICVPFSVYDDSTTFNQRRSTGNYERRSTMKRRKSLRIVLIVLASLLVLYLIPSIYVGCRLNKIIQESYNSFGENNPYPETISDTLYRKLCCGRNRNVADHADHENFRHTFPLTIFWPGGNKAFFWYDHEAIAINGGISSGRWDCGVMVTHQWKNGKWVITDVYEPGIPFNVLFYHELFDVPY